MNLYEHHQILEHQQLECFNSLLGLTTKKISKFYITRPLFEYMGDRWIPLTFHKQFFHRNQNLMEKWFKCNSIVGYHITTKFCTCHDSTAVMPCAKFDNNHPTTILMRAELNSQWIWITMAKSFVAKNVESIRVSGVIQFYICVTVTAPQLYSAKLSIKLKKQNLCK